MDFLQFLRALSRSGNDFVIVGGVAARLYGSSRLTHDIDVVPELNPENWPRLVECIWNAGARPRIPEPLESIRNLAQVRKWNRDKGLLALSFRAPDGTAEIDLLIASPEEYEGLRARAQVITLDGASYRIASLDDLIEMKRKAGRPQDLLDIEELERIRKRTNP